MIEKLAREGVVYAEVYVSVGVDLLARPGI